MLALMNNDMRKADQLNTASAFLVGSSEMSTITHFSFQVFGSHLTLSFSLQLYSSWLSSSEKQPIFFLSLVLIEEPRLTFLESILVT